MFNLLGAFLDFALQRRHTTAVISEYFAVLIVDDVIVHPLFVRRVRRNMRALRRDRVAVMFALLSDLVGRLKNVPRKTLFPWVERLHIQHHAVRLRRDKRRPM